MKKFGFTLAEILITLTIIGIVASMTIPSLVNNIGDQQNRVAWKKAYADFSQATMRLVADNGGSISGLVTNGTVLKNYYLTYLNYTKHCNETNNVYGVCWHQNGTCRYLNGNFYADSYEHSALILNNGTMIRIKRTSTTCTSTSKCGYVEIDVNGFSGPNTYGKDIFQANIYDNRILPVGALSTWICPDGDGLDCSAKYLVQ